MSTFKNLYILTGKGGVGKTTLSFAIAKYLQENGRSVKYIHLDTGSLSDLDKVIDPGSSLANILNVECEHLELKECAQNYMAQKLKSEMISKWIVKTPFFKSLINMMPGFNYLIYLGRILEDLKANPDLTIILDSPSSGHALTMLESTHNFREIFQSGIVFDDTQKMIDLMFKPGFLQVNILTLPTLMAVHEGIELNQSLQKITSINSKIFCNNSYHNLK